MKVLLLASKPFLPVLDGGNEASRALAQELLLADFELKAITFSSEKHPFHPELFNQGGWQKLQIEHFPVSLYMNPLKALLGLLSGTSYNLSRFSSKAWLSRIKTLLRENDFDIILFDSLFSAGDFEAIRSFSPNSKFIIRTHNVESNIWREKAENETLFPKKKYLSILASQLDKREKEILSKMDNVLPISLEDLHVFNSWGIQKTTLLPYFPEVGKGKYNSSTSNLIFMGSMNWQPNVEAHDQLVQSIFPEITEQFPNIKLLFAGGQQDQLKKSYAKNIEYRGFVDDKVTFLTENGILLAPIQSGSGVRIKIIEALSLGVPVVTTVKGAEGIPFESGDGIFIAKNEKEFIEFASKLILNEDVRKETSSKAITNLENWKRKYDLKSIFEGNG